MFFFNLFSIAAVVSPLLALFAWKKFFAGDIGPARPRWKTALEWLATLSVSTLSVVCVAASCIIPGDVDRYRWGCVDRWRFLSAVVVRLTPSFLLLSLFARKGTRIPSFRLVIAINFDCLMVDVWR
jgi:hypothetical protein